LGDFIIARKAAADIRFCAQSIGRTGSFPAGDFRWNRSFFCALQEGFFGGFGDT
jgi:hypothetical protein